jgi:hypothetical protein
MTDEYRAPFPRLARRRRSFFVALVSVALVPLGAAAATLTVSNANDSGEGSFRQAITNAN